MKIIALIAESGAGKGLFVEIIKKLLSQLRIASIRFSDPLSDILTILGKEKTRDNIDRLVTALREAFDDQGVLTKAVQKCLELVEADIVILDGLRKEQEISFIRERNGILVYVASDQRMRYERRKQEPEKPDELGMSWEQFVLQGDAPPQREIRRIGETMADVTIKNNGTVQDFESNIKEFITKYHLAEK